MRIEDNSNVEIYTEFSLQHELGIFLRRQFGTGYSVQFERPVSFFDLPRSDFLKKEIDIDVFTEDQAEKYAIELKFPRNGQHPEQISKACQDIAFLEQLQRHGFTNCFFIIAVDDPLLYSGQSASSIYRFFCGSISIHGVIQKPTGKKDESVDVVGCYSMVWEPSMGTLRHSVIAVDIEGHRTFPRGRA